MLYALVFMSTRIFMSTRKFGGAMVSVVAPVRRAVGGADGGLDVEPVAA
jgi:hypothetical protein